MTRQERDRALAGALQLLSRRHPAAHPFTLSLELQAQTGQIISGAEAARLLALDSPPQPTP